MAWHFNPAQPRDAHGRWVKGAGSALKALEAVIKGHGGDSGSPVSQGDARLAQKAYQRHIEQGRKFPGQGTSYEDTLKNMQAVADGIRSDAVKWNKKDPKIAQQLRKQARAMEKVQASHDESKPMPGKPLPGQGSDTATKSKAQPVIINGKKIDVGYTFQVAAATYAVTEVTSTHITVLAKTSKKPWTLTHEEFKVAGYAGSPRAMPKPLPPIGAKLSQVVGTKHIRVVEILGHSTAGKEDITKLGEDPNTPVAKVRAINDGKMGNEPFFLRAKDLGVGEETQTKHVFGIGGLATSQADVKKFSNEELAQHIDALESATKKGDWSKVTPGGNWVTRMVNGKKVKWAKKEHGDLRPTDQFGEAGLKLGTRLGESYRVALQERASRKNKDAPAPNGVDQAKLDAELAAAQKESLAAGEPRYTVKATGGAFHVHDAQTGQPVATFDDRGKARRNARARNRKLGIGPKTKGGGGAKKKLAVGSWVTNKDGRRGEIVAINPTKEIELPQPEGLIDAEEVLGSVDNPYSANAISKPLWEQGFIAGFNNGEPPVGHIGYAITNGYREGIKARKAELAKIRQEQRVQKAEAKGGFVVRYNTGRTEVLQSRGLKETEPPVAIYRHKGEPPAQASSLYDALKSGVEADETDWSLLDPARRSDIPKAAVVGHAQEVLFDLARGNERPKEAKVVSNTELRGQLLQEGFIEKARERAEKKLAYKIRLHYQISNAYGHDENVRQSKSKFGVGGLTVKAPDDPLTMQSLRALYAMSQGYEVKGQDGISRSRPEIYNILAHPNSGESLIDHVNRLGLAPVSGAGDEAFKKLRQQQINKSVDTVVAKEIAARREKEGTTSIAYDLPHWNGVQMIEQTWSDVGDHVNLASRGSFVPVFHAHGRVEDAVVYHRKDGTTAARVLTGEADKLTQEAMLKAGGKVGENSKNIDPGYRGRGKIYPGTMISIQLEEGRKVTNAEGHREALAGLHDRPEKASPGPTPFPRGEFISALKAIVAMKENMSEGQWNDAIREAHHRALLASDKKAKANGQNVYQYEKSELEKGAVQELQDSVKRAYSRTTGGKSIEYVPHEQPKLGAPTSQRGRFTIHGLSPEEATKKMQELGLVGEMESHVPFEVVMRSGRRDGLVLPLHRDYLTGDSPPPTLLHLITHGITSHDPKVIESVLRGGGLHSIAERYRRGIRVNSSSPSGDIRSGIDHVIFGAHDSGSTCGGNSPVKIAYKPEALLRRNVVMAPRDYGSLDSRYDMYKKYVNGLQKRAGEPTASLYQPVSPAVRQAHIAARKRPGSAEFNISGSIPVEDMAVIGVQNKQMADTINKILDEELAAGRIASRPDVVVGREEFRVRVEA